MSHPRYTNKDTDFVTLVFIILIASAAWEHKTGLMQIEHIAKYVLIGIALVFVLLYILKAKKKLTGKFGFSGRSFTEIDKMTGLEFEKYLVVLLKNQGYRSIRLTEKYDYGIDIIAIKDGIKWGIQAKRYGGLVDVDAVRQVVTALAKYRCQRSMVITNSYYTEVAKEMARCNKCILIDRDKLKHWVI